MGSRRRTAIWLVALACVLSLGFAVVRLVQANAAGHDGRRALLAATDALHARDVPAARRSLASAAAAFERADSLLGGGGPALAVARVTPLVRIQLRAARDLANAGSAASTAGLVLMPTAQQLIGGRGVEGGVAALSSAEPQVDRSVDELVAARDRLADLRRFRLLGPLNRQQREAERRLDEAVRLGERGRDGLRVLLELSGSTGPKRFLLLSQNPDEPRPTGGYMGTYGVLVARSGKVKLERYGATGQWNVDHPQAAVPPSKAPFPFRYVDEVQDLGNAGTTPDWPASAAKARAIWLAGGEADVDGVVTFAPRLIERMLAVLGPVRVPGYPTPVSAASLDRLLEQYVHSEEAFRLPVSQRKQFVGDVAKVVLDRAVHAPGAQLPDLLEAADTALVQGEAAVWSRRTPVQNSLRDLEWDGALVATAGDFYADAEFAFASKNGRGLHRVFDHEVTLAPDGSGISTTTTVISNPQPRDAFRNPGAALYLTPYGPKGGVLTSDSDPYDAKEPALQGHPTAGWLRTPPPGWSARLTVSWRAPALLLRRSDGTWEYRLTWRPLPAHRGDVLRLHVAPPAGWHWVSPPPAEITLDGPYFGAWLLSPDNAK